MKSHTSALGIAAIAVLRPDEPRVGTPDLLERLRPGFPDLSRERLGRALTAAGWRPCQWRTGGGRVRGYATPKKPPTEALHGPEAIEGSMVTPNVPSAVRTPSAAVCASHAREAGRSPGSTSGAMAPELTGPEAAVGSAAPQLAHTTPAGTGYKAPSRVRFAFTCPRCGGHDYFDSPPAKFCVRCRPADPGDVW